MTGRCICIMPQKGFVFQSSSSLSFLRASYFLVSLSLFLPFLFFSRIRLLFSRTLFGQAREPLGRQQPMKNSEGTARWRGRRWCDVAAGFFSPVPCLMAPQRRARAGIPNRHYLIVLSGRGKSLSLSLSLFWDIVMYVDETEDTPDRVSLTNDEPLTRNTQVTICPSRTSHSSPLSLPCHEKSPASISCRSSIRSCRIVRLGIARNN